MAGLRAFIREGTGVAGIMVVGDAIAQFGISKKPLKEWDYVRTMKFGALGLFYVAPVMRFWIGSLEKLVRKEQPRLQRAVKKMLIDQTFFAPSFTVTMLYICPSLNGVPHSEVVNRMKQDYFNIMRTNYLLWPPAQIINFSVIPLHYQVIFVQMVALIWNTYLSYKLNK